MTLLRFYFVPQAYGLAHGDWQVLFQKEDELVSPITLAAAREMGYTIGMTEGRYIFRSPYGQPDSTVALVSYSLILEPNYRLLNVDLLRRQRPSPPGGRRDGGHRARDTVHQERVDRSRGGPARRLPNE